MQNENDHFKKKEKDSILNKIPKNNDFNKSTKTLANDYCKIFKPTKWRLINKQNIIFYEDHAIKEIHSIDQLSDLMNNEYTKYLPENKPNLT